MRRQHSEARAKENAAELAIQREGHKPNFSLALLQIVASQSISSTIRLAGALYFKNHIKRNWIVSTIGRHMPQGRED